VITRESALSRGQQLSLALLRMLVGWHFLYEGYFKLWRPAWSRDGTPLPAWTSAGYLKAAGGPFADVFHRLADSAWLGAIDTVVAVTLFLAGLSLVLGLFTEVGGAAALGLLGMFYVSSIPTLGLPEAHSEGTYLFVNKNLIEAAAVLVLLVFEAGRIAGLDSLRGARRQTTRHAAEEART
jgi:thiosulfate dehydrogenase [quinone] large subunit